MKNLSILGSTGSIGCNALKIVEMFPQRFCVKALAAKTNITLLAEQIEQFTPELAVVYDEDSARQLKNKLAAGTKVDILCGEDGYRTAASQQGQKLTFFAAKMAIGPRLQPMVLI
jgi:1-deoxy-D-xylulose-5-phosphate reductoisomerase